MSINITQHASKRIKERLSIKNQKSKEKVVSDALMFGITANNCPSCELRYLLQDLNRNGNNTFYYKEHIFIFKKDVLITVLPTKARITREYNKNIRNKFVA